MRARVLGITTAAALAAAVAGCGSSSTGATATPGAGDADAITITARDFMFTPASVDLVAGRQVTIKLVNGGENEHSVSTGGNDIVEAEKGETKTGTFTPTTSGKVEFYCKYHKITNGMVGSFNVTGTAPAASASASGSSAPTTTETKPYPY